MLGEGNDDSLRLTSGVSSDKTKACLESNVKTVCCASVLSRESSIRTSTSCRKLYSITETTIMDECNGTNVKPVSPIVFFFFF
jgi:hypothetical protein